MAHIGCRGKCGKGPCLTFRSMYPDHQLVKRSKMLEALGERILNGELSMPQATKKDVAMPWWSRP